MTIDPVRIIAKATINRFVETRFTSHTNIPPTILMAFDGGGGAEVGTGSDITRVTVAEGSAVAVFANNPKAQKWETCAVIVPVPGSLCDGISFHVPVALSKVFTVNSCPDGVPG